MMTRRSALFSLLASAVVLAGAAGSVRAAGGKGTHAGGRVMSVDAAAKSFVVSHRTKDGGDKEVTILTIGTTEFKKGEAAASWSDIKTGVHVRAEGTTGADGKFTATSVVIGGHKKAAPAPAAPAPK